MKKTPFTVRCENSLKEVLGYVISQDGVCVGIDQRKSPINSDKRWYVTELSTGMRLPFKYRTRKDAIDGFKALLPKIKEVLSLATTKKLYS